LKTIYTCADQMKRAFPTEITLLENLKSTCVKIVGDQLNRDHQVVLKQSDEYLNAGGEQMTIKSQDQISSCAHEAPRISNNYKKSTTSKNFHLFSALFRLIYILLCLVMAKEVAQYLHPLSTTPVDNEQQVSVWKGYAYQSYRSLISTICQMLEKVSATFVDEQIRSNNRREPAMFCTRERRAQLLTGPPSSRITYPEPQPGKFILVSL
jgi:hypothetical protein